MALMRIVESSNGMHNVNSTADEPNFHTVSMVAEAAAGKSRHQQLRAHARGRRDDKPTAPKESADQIIEEAEASHPSS